MRALLFGPTGQVGTELQARAGARGIEVTAVGRADADLRDAERCAAAVAGSDADIVVNAAAYTAVDQAEDEQDAAFAVNGAAPGAMARAARARGVPLLHISTDYVFEGLAGNAFGEDDAVGPVGAYGQSKLAGERAVLEAGGDAVILRTAWVFSAHGNNFVKTMLKHGKTRGEMRVVADQIGSPTAAGDIAEALWTIAAALRDGRGESGVFHFGGAPATSWADFARAIFAATGWEAKPAVTGIRTDEWPTRTRRPANSVLDCGKIARVYGIAQPDWRVALNAVISDLGEA